MMILFWFWCYVELLVDTSILEKHAVSIFVAELAMLRGGGIYLRLKEGKAGGECQSETRNEGEKLLG
jgi:hypothetical protein